MVAVIKSAISIGQTFNYNEHKVSKGVAECIGAANYPMDLEGMTQGNKLSRLVNQVALNENIKRPCIHISLNFSPSDQISNKRMVTIADTYMKKMGFGGQPYLIYRHYDAGHPHMHLVSISVGPDGRRINRFREGRMQIVTACRKIEQAFGLVSTGGHSPKQTSTGLSSQHAQKVHYGKTPSKMTIAGVLDLVLNDYKYTSLAQFNAVLASYNVTASRGAANSLTYRNGGLVYHILDDTGKKVGVPIKASDFDSRPTLKLLEEKYKANKINRERDVANVKNALDLILLKQPVDSVASLKGALEKEGIRMVLRKNADGSLADITYVDFRRKSVFDGDALGGSYSAPAIEKRCSPRLSEVQKTTLENYRQLMIPTVSDETLHPPLVNDPDTAGHPASEGPNKTLKVGLKKDYSYHHQEQLKSSEKQKAKKRGRHL